MANWYGVKTGVLVGFAYGLLQFLQEPYVLSLYQVCCDYVFAFAALGLAGFFRNRKNGLVWGYIVAVLAGRVSLSGRLSLLDGLHARQLPPVPQGPLPHHLQLQLPAGPREC